MYVGLWGKKRGHFISVNTNIAKSQPFITDCQTLSLFLFLAQMSGGSWSRSFGGSGRRPAPHFESKNPNSNREEGEIASSSWGPVTALRTDSAGPVHSSTVQSADSQYIPPRPDLSRTDREARTNPSSFSVSTGVPIPARSDVPVGNRFAPSRHDRDPRFKAASPSIRFNHNKSWHPPDRDRSTSFPQRRGGSTADTHSPKHSTSGFISGGMNINTPSASRNFSVSDIGSRNEYNNMDGREYPAVPSSPFIMDGIGVPMPGPKPSAGGGGGGGGGKWKSGSGGSWMESGPREKKFSPWPSKPAFPIPRASTFHEGSNKGSDMDTRPMSTASHSFLNKFDRRAPPGGWDRKIPASKNVSDSSRDYYGPSTAKDPPVHGGTPQEVIKTTYDPVDTQPPVVQASSSHVMDRRRFDGDGALLRKIQSEQPEALDMDRVDDVSHHISADRFQIRQTIPLPHEATELLKDGPILGAVDVVAVSAIKPLSIEMPNASVSPDKKAGTMIRITTSSLGHEDKIVKAEFAVRRLSQIMSKEDLNVRHDFVLA